jgi:outer membrane protein insertion porin family
MHHRFTPLLAALCLSAPVFAGESAPVVQSVVVTESNLAVNLATQVGQPYDTSTIDHDVKYLWSLGRFEDIRVETAPEEDGVAVTFRVVPAPRASLREIRIEPNSYGLHLSVPAGAQVDPMRAEAVARDAEKQLRARGFPNATVAYDFLPLGNGAVDLRLRVDPGDSIRVKGVEITGNTGLPPKELRGALHGLRAHRLLPGVPHLWDGWRLLPSYSDDAVNSDLARLHSLYLSKGYFDATVRAGDPIIHGKDARLQLVVDSGPRYLVRSTPGAMPVPFDSRAFCTSLIRDRGAAQRTGVLDYSATLNVQPEGLPGNGPPIAGLTTGIERGKPYRLARLDILGNAHFRDSTVRRMFLLNEGDPLDDLKLRKSLARLNRTGLFEPMGTDGISVRTNPDNGFAAVTVRLTEKKFGAWSISGPVGPASWGGPFEGYISMRLPAWGRGLAELSTYTVSFGMMAFLHPLIPVAGLPKNFFSPIVALRRPYLPGQSWLSGLAFSPEIGWQFSALSYAMGQLNSHVVPLLEGNRALIPDLPVAVQTPDGGGTMMCSPPAPRMWAWRKAAALVLGFAGALSSF